MCIERGCNDIQICASVFEKLRSHDERSTDAYNHLKACEEFTVKGGCLKIVSVEVEAHWNSNKCVIYCMRSIMHKLWLTL